MKSKKIISGGAFNSLNEHLPLTVYLYNLGEISLGKRENLWRQKCWDLNPLNGRKHPFGEAQMLFFGTSLN